MKLGIHGLQPRAVSASLDSFDKADPPAANFQTVLKSSDVHMLADEFEGSARGSRIEREKSVSIVVENLFSRLGVPDWPYLLHTSLVKLDGLPQDPFGVDLRGHGTFSLGLSDGSGDLRFFQVLLADLASAVPAVSGADRRLRGIKVYKKLRDESLLLGGKFRVHVRCLRLPAQFSKSLPIKYKWYVITFQA